LPSNTEGSQSEACLNKDNFCLNKEVETAACLNSEDPCLNKEAIKTVKRHQFSLFEADYDCLNNELACLNNEDPCLNKDLACLNKEIEPTTLMYDNESQTYTSVITGDRFTLNYQDGVLVGVVYRMCRGRKVTLLGLSQINSRYKMAISRGNKTASEWGFLWALFK
jgi:hypothetical protein